MRTIPVDSNRVSLVGTGKQAARAEYVELSDGSRRRSGEQAKDDSGVPVWVIDVLVDDDDADRAEVIGVRVSSWDEPKTEKYKPVVFRNLVAVPYADRSTGRVALSMRADGIESGSDKPATAGSGTAESSPGKSPATKSDQPAA